MTWKVGADIQSFKYLLVFWKEFGKAFGKLASDLDVVFTQSCHPSFCSVKLLRVNIRGQQYLGAQDNLINICRNDWDEESFEINSFHVSTVRHINYWGRHSGAVVREVASQQKGHSFVSFEAFLCGIGLWVPELF